MTAKKTTKKATAKKPAAKKATAKKPEPIANLTETLANLIPRVETLEERISAAERHLASNNGRVNELTQDQIKAVRSRGSLQADIASLKEALAAHDEMIADLQVEANELDQELEAEALTTEVTEVKDPPYPVKSATLRNTPKVEAATPPPAAPVGTTAIKAHRKRRDRGYGGIRPRG